MGVSLLTEGNQRRVNERGITVDTTSGVADQCSLNLGNVIRCPDAITTSKHQTLNFKYDMPLSPIDSGFTFTRMPRLAPARDPPSTTTHNVARLDDPNDIPPSHDVFLGQGCGSY